MRTLLVIMKDFVQTQIRVNIYLAFTRIERAKMDGKIQESLWDIVKPCIRYFAL